jgi:hypothetical protein
VKCLIDAKNSDSCWWQWIWMWNLLIKFIAYWNIFWNWINKIVFFCYEIIHTLVKYSPDFPKLAEKLSVIQTDRHEDLVRPKNILPVRKKSPKKFTVMCIMFSLAFSVCFTIVLAIGHLISPLVFIEVKVIQFLVFSVVQNCICYVFYSVCLVFGLSSFLALSHQSNASFLPSDSIFDDILIV